MSPNYENSQPVIAISSEDENAEDHEYSLEDVPGYNPETEEIEQLAVLEWALDSAMEQTADDFPSPKYGLTFNQLEVDLVRPLIDRKVAQIASEYKEFVTHRRFDSIDDIHAAEREMNTETDVEVLLERTIDQMVSEGYMTDKRGEFLREKIEEYLDLSVNFKGGKFLPFDSYFISQAPVAGNEVDAGQRRFTKRKGFEEFATGIVSLATDRQRGGANAFSEERVPNTDEVLTVLNRLGEEYVNAVIRSEFVANTIYNLIRHREFMDEFIKRSEKEMLRKIFDKELGRLKLIQATEWMLIDAEFSPEQISNGDHNSKGAKVIGDVIIEERNVYQKFYAISIRELKSSARGGHLDREVLRVYPPVDQQGAEIPSGVASWFAIGVIFDESPEVIEKLKKVDNAGIKLMLRNFGFLEKEERSPTPSPSH